MSNNIINTDDSVRQFANPGMISKAPEGFTAGVMNRIQTETETVKVIITEKKRSRNLVPLISAAIIILLMAISVIVSDNSRDSWAYPVLAYFKSIELSLPKIDITLVFSSGISSIAGSVVIGFFILTLFDRALYGIFHKEKLSGSQK